MDDHENQSPNYDYVIQSALALTDISNPKVLDFGCGRGQLVSAARKRGLDFSGADTFEGHYSTWSDELANDVERALIQIKDGRIDAEDNSFDIVVSNQVFEHIEHPPAVLAEIARVLKPGGTFLALFPTADIWFEGHIGLYFVHWMKTRSSSQRRYLSTARKLGFGYYTQNLDGERWVDHAMTKLEEVIFYHRYRDIRTWWTSTFGTSPACQAADYMRFRIGVSRMKSLAPIANLSLMAPVLRFICRKRAGRVLVVRNTKPG